MNKLYKYFTILIATWPLLNVYGTPIKGFGVGDILIILLLPFIILKSFNVETKNNYAYKKMIFLLIIFLFVSLLSSLLSIMIFNGSILDIVKRWIVMIFHLAVFIICARNNIIDLVTLKKVYYFCALISSVAIFVQFIYHYAFNQNLYLLIKQLKYNQPSLSTFMDYKKQYDLMYLYNFRPTSFFLEPSHFSLYVAPSVYLLLFKENSRKSVIASLLISVAIILSTSGVGVMIISMIWIIYILYGNGNSKILLRIVTIIFVLLILFILIKNNFLDIFNSRIKDIGSGNNSSINVRLLKGFSMYPKMNLYEQILGIGLGGYDSYVRFAGNSIQLQNYEYMNSISYILVSTGMIGFIIFCLFINSLKNYYKNNKNLLIVLIIIIMYFTGSVAFSCYDTFILVLGTLSLAKIEYNEKKMRW